MRIGQPQLQSIDPSSPNRDVRTELVLSHGTIHDQFPDITKVSEQIYRYVKANELKNLKFLLCNDIYEHHHQTLDLISIIDSKQNSLLHHAVAQDNQIMFQELVQFSERQNGKQQTLKWISLENSSGYQCTHIACHRGNLGIIKILARMGIDFSSKNKIGLSCLHIAAQSDQVKLLYYFIKVLQQDMNQLDNSNGTPLHQASYFGAETSASLLLAWGCKTSLQDLEGRTPLHFTALTGQNKIMRRLLYYGADPTLRTNKGETALQITEQQEFPKQTQFLKDFQGCPCKLKIVCGTHSLAKHKSSNRLQLILFIIMQLSCICYEFLYTISNDLYGYIQCGILGLNLIMFIWLIYSDPGKLSKYPDNFEWIIQNCKTQEICAECQSFKPPRSKHCDFCKRCVAVYDHHCPWINNCIGCKNHLLFIIFICILYLTIIITILIIVNSFVEFIPFLEGISNQLLIQQLFDLEIFNSFSFKLVENNIIQTMQLYYAIYLFTILGLFFLLMSCLIYVQIRNLRNNQTTYEKINNNIEYIVLLINLDTERVNLVIQSLKIVLPLKDYFNNQIGKMVDVLRCYAKIRNKSYIFQSPRTQARVSPLLCYPEYPEYPEYKYQYNFMDSHPKLSAAIILIREQESGTYKTLLLQRNSKISYGSSYAFPGGTVDNSDLLSKDPKIHACLRELQEETTLSISDENVFPFFRMVTPAILSIKRHDNQFYIKFLKDDKSLDQILIDKSENITYRWDYPMNFINDFLNKTIMVTPPVYYLLFTLIKQNTKPNLFKYYKSLNQESLKFPII